MKSIIHPELASSDNGELQRVIEPLASYVCAADRPRAALLSALEFLFNEVSLTNRVATAQVSAFSHHSCLVENL